MPQQKSRRRIAPRLASGDRRIPFGHGLPEAIKDGLREIARMENQSMAWVLEQLIVDWLCSRSSFQVEVPDYQTRSAQPPTQTLVQPPRQRHRRQKNGRRRTA